MAEHQAARRRFIWIGYFAWVGAIATVGTILMLLGGYRWSPSITVAMQALTWGLASAVWLLTNLLFGLVASLAFGIGDGSAQYALSAFLILVLLASLQFLVLWALVRLARTLANRIAGGDHS